MNMWYIFHAMQPERLKLYAANKNGWFLTHHRGTTYILRKQGIISADHFFSKNFTAV